MAIYTPRGLKIRLPADYAFALIARLHPNVDAWRVLKTTEGLMCMPGMLSLVAGIACVAAHVPPLHLGLAVFFASLAGGFITRRGIVCLVPVLPGLATASSYLSGSGVLLILQVVGGSILVGWRSVSAFYLGTWAASLCNYVFEVMHTKNIARQSKVVLTASEINFINAYRIHARALGLDTEVKITNEELSSEHWRAAFSQYAIKNLEVVERFSDWRA